MPIHTSISLRVEVDVHGLCTLVPESWEIYSVVLIYHVTIAPCQPNTGSENLCKFHGDLLLETVTNSEDLVLVTSSPCVTMAVLSSQRTHRWKGGL